MTQLFSPAEIIVRSGAYLEGDFTLKDGSKSDCFVDLGRVSNGADLGYLVAHMVKQLRMLSLGTREVLVGPPYKAIPLVTLLSYYTGLPFDYYRKEKKKHGEGGDWVTKALQPMMNAWIIDDVYTAGTAKREAIGRVREAGANPLGILVVVDRTDRMSPPYIDGVHLRSLTTLAEIKRVYQGLKT